MLVFVRPSVPQVSIFHSLTQIDQSINQHKNIPFCLISSSGASCHRHRHHHRHQTYWCSFLLIILSKVINYRQLQLSNFSLEWRKNGKTWLCTCARTFIHITQTHTFVQLEKETGAASMTCMSFMKRWEQRGKEGIAFVGLDAIDVVPNFRQLSFRNPKMFRFLESLFYFAGADGWRGGAKGGMTPAGPMTIPPPLPAPVSGRRGVRKTSEIKNS